MDAETLDLTGIIGERVLVGKSEVIPDFWEAGLRRLAERPADLEKFKTLVEQATPSPAPKGKVTMQSVATFARQIGIDPDATCEDAALAFTDCIKLATKLTGPLGDFRARHQGKLLRIKFYIDFIASPDDAGHFRTQFDDAIPDAIYHINGPGLSYGGFIRFDDYSKRDNPLTNGLMPPGMRVCGCGINGGEDIRKLFLLFGLTLPEVRERCSYAGWEISGPVEYDPAKYRLTPSPAG